MRVLVLVIGALALAGCESEVERAEKRYEMVKDSAALDPGSLCQAGREVAAAHLEEGNEWGYKVAQSRVYNDCHSNGL